MSSPLAYTFPMAQGFGQVYPVAWRRETVTAPGRAFPGAAGLLVCLQTGEGSLTLDGASHGYGPQTVFGISGNSRLEFSPSSATTCLALELEQAGPLLALPFPVEEPAVSRRMAQLYQEAQEGLPGDVYSASAQVYSLLMDLHRACAGSRGGYSELVQDAMAIMREEYAYLTGMDELAQRLEVSKGHLVRSFSAQAGKGPGRYLQQVRLEHARMILAAGEYPVELVAGMTGYSCANYFCKVFRKEYGISPGSYREQHRLSSGGETPRGLEEAMVF